MFVLIPSDYQVTFVMIRSLPLPVLTLTISHRRNDPGSKAMKPMIACCGCPRLYEQKSVQQSAA